MSKVTVKYREVVNPIDKITIELTENEAKSLNYVLRQVGGSPEKSIRKHVEKLSQELNTIFPQNPKSTAESYMYVKSTSLVDCVDLAKDDPILK